MMQKSTVLRHDALCTFYLPIDLVCCGINFHFFEQKFDIYLQIIIAISIFTSVNGLEN